MLRLEDPLLAYTPLPYHHVLYPLGFPLLVKSNDSAVIRAAEISWGAFAPRSHEMPIELRFIVSEIPSRRRPPVPTFRAQANLLTLIADAHNYGCCDLGGGFGFACVTKATTTNRDYLRYHFLEAMASALLDTQYILAIHAACVGIDGHGVLLVGDSGAGKSSFAYASARRGWTYISDDGTALVLHKSGRYVLGNPQSLRLRPSASALFPEIKGTGNLRNGKPTIEIRTETRHRVTTAYECTVDYIIFLNRQDSEPDPVSLKPLPQGEARRRLSTTRWPEELSINEDRFAAIERLLNAKAFQLTYKSFEPALELVEATVRGGNS
jgi:HPr Serine kinase C-terminal domain